MQEISTDEHYVLNGEKYIVTFEYQGQEMTTVNIDCGTFENEIKRGSVEGEKINKNGDPLANALFGLFRTGTEDFSAAAAIMTDISDENGHFEFTEIPYGEYVVREIEAPTGYILSDELYPVTIAEDGDVIEITAENDEISIAISKEDIYGAELPGAKMQLVDEDGNVFDEWTSDGTNHIISEIPAGDYTLHEVAAPDGYVIATDISFTIDEYGVVTVDDVTAEAHTEDGTPLMTMVDDTTVTTFSKQDATTGEELPGATLQVIDADGEVVEEWVSTNEPHMIEAVLVAGGTYTLKEITAPDGYLVAEDVEFTVNEDGTVTEVVMLDDSTKVRISKQDATTGQELPGAKLQVIDADGNVVDEWISTTEPHMIEAVLTAGASYTLKEITAPDGYEVAEEVPFTVKDDGSITEVVMKDTPTPKLTPTTPTTPSVPSSPPTGDAGANPMAYVLIVAGAVGIALIICRKKKED